MRSLLAFLLILCASTGVKAQDSDSGTICRVSILSNSIDLPDDRRDGLLLLRVFVSTSSSCVSGQVEIAAYPTMACPKEPSTDLNRTIPLTFSYKPAVLKLTVEPGNINSGIIEINTDGAGSCKFNSHIASCGTAVPAGGRCAARDLTDPHPEAQGEVSQDFNRVR